MNGFGKRLVRLDMQTLVNFKFSENISWNSRKIFLWKFMKKFKHFLWIWAWTTYFVHPYQLLYCNTNAQRSWCRLRLADITKLPLWQHTTPLIEPAHILYFHLSLITSMVRGSCRSSRGYGFDPLRDFRNIFWEHQLGQLLRIVCHDFKLAHA